MARKQEPLTPGQLAALAALGDGASEAEAAQAAGADLAELRTWERESASFAAALNRIQQDRWQAHADRLRGLVAPALDALAGLLQSEDERIKHAAAVSVLRSVGLWGTDLEPRGATTAEGVQRDRYFDSL